MLLGQSYLLQMQNLKPLLLSYPPLKLKSLLLSLSYLLQKQKSLLLGQNY